MAIDDLRVVLNGNDQELCRQTREFAGEADVRDALELLIKQSERCS